MFHPTLESLLAHRRKVEPQQITGRCEPAPQGDRNVEARRLNLGIETVQKSMGIRRFDLAKPFIQPPENLGSMVGPTGFEDY